MSSLLVTRESWASWEDLEREALACTKCPLAAGRIQVVFGAGARDADLVFVGEGPGAEEDKQGIPFVGRAGQLLTRLIDGIGMTRDEVYIANVVKCRPPGNRDPQPEEIAACRPYLEAQLSFLGPKVIMTLGNFATKLLLDTKEGITKLRGQEFTLPVGEAGAFGEAGAVGEAKELGGLSKLVTLVPTLHPSAVLRNGGAALAQSRADFVVAKRALVRASA
jgi:uracil-DNA glycosylase family 4